MSDIVKNISSIYDETLIWSGIWSLSDSCHTSDLE